MTLSQGRSTMKAGGISQVATGKHSAPSKKKTTKASAGTGRTARSQGHYDRTKRPAKKSHAGHVAGGVAVVAIIVLVVAILAFKVIPSFNSGKVLEGQEITVEIAEGSSASQIGEALKTSGVIASASDFTNAIREQGGADQLKAGVYRFTGGEPVSSIINTLISGKTGFVVTIPEGYTAKKIAKTVAKTCDGIDNKGFYELTLKADDYVADYPFLQGVYNNSLEGYLFPDTYNIPYGATTDDVVRMMLDNFSAKIASVDMSYATSKNLDTYDVVTLASMIEKESRSSDDKASISSVFYNRLRNGMNLGSDVTTYYAVGKELTEDLTKADLASDSPYNTRNPNVKGLPAGPICCPGIESLNAAAHPDETDYLYFFYSNSQNKTMFYKDQSSFDKAWAKYGD